MFKRTLAAKVLFRPVVVGICAVTVSVCAAEIQWEPPVAINSYAEVDNVAVHDVLPAVATDGAGKWMTVWTVAEDYEVRAFGNSLKAAFSSNLGESWTNHFTFPLNLRDGYIGNADVVYAGNGRWVATWGGRKMRDIMISSSTDDGQTWSPAQKVLEEGFSHQISSDGDGTVIIFYRNNGFHLLRSTDGGVTWADPVTVHSGEILGLTPLIDYAGGDLWYLVANSNPPQVYASSDNGATWQTKARVNTQIWDMAADGSKIVIAGRDNQGFSAYYSTDGGETFKYPALDNIQISEASINHDENGHWTAFSGALFRDDTGEIRGWRSDDGITWSTMTDLETSAPTSAGPDVQGGSGSEFLLVYHNKWGNSPPQFSDADILSIASTDGGQTWTAPNSVSPSGTTDSSNVQDQSVMIAGNENTLVASWIIYLDDIFSPADEEQSMMTSISHDSGQTWSTAVEVADGIPRGRNHDPVYNGDSKWILPWRIFGTTAPTNTMGYVASEDNGMTWSQPKIVTGVLIASNGNGLLLKAADGAIERSTDNGLSWQATGTSIDFRPGLLVHVGGQNWLVATASGELVALQNDGSSSVKLGISENLGQMILHNFGTDHNGNLIATGSTGEGLRENIYASVSDDGGFNWSEITRVHTVMDFSLGSEYISDENLQARAQAFWTNDDRWVLVTRSRTSYFRLFGDGPYFRNSDIYLAYTHNNGASWTYAEHAIELPVEGDLRQITNTPDYAMAGGEVVVANSHRSPDYDVFLYRSERLSEPPIAHTAAQDWQLYN